MRTITIIFLMITVTIFSQNKTVLSENQFEVLKSKVKLQVRNNLDSAFYYCNRIEVSENNLHKAFANSYKAYIFQIKKDTLSSNEHMNRAFLFIKNEKKSLAKNKIETQLLNLNGLIYRKRGKYSMAIDEFMKGIILAKGDNDIQQLIKFNNNIASVNSDIGNFNFAISSLKENNRLIDQYKSLYTKEDYFKSKNLVNYNIGENLLRIYKRENQIQVLDSAEYYLKSALFYSENLMIDKVSVLISLGSIKLRKTEYVEAQQYYTTAYRLAVENKLFNEQIIIKYNLGYINFLKGNNEKALLYFREVDSIDNFYKVKGTEFMKSNYYQGKIYYLLNDYEKGLKHLNIYYDLYDKKEKNIISQSLEINDIISSEQIKEDVDSLRQDIKIQNFLNLLGKFFIFLLFIVLIFVLFKINLEKKRANEKVQTLLSEFKENKNSKSSFELKRSVNIDDVKEQEILGKLEALIDKQFFLSPDFNQQIVAKKIKTNTTYLSYIVNKNFDKSFSEYANELKINYAIEQLINNPTYRKYSTQAIAESVGFKNAISFTKSFKKRAGVSPAQFILRIDRIS
jgi:AraC-like DNA-binding protein